MKRPSVATGRSPGASWRRRVTAIRTPHLPPSYVRKIRFKRFLASLYRDDVLFLASALSFDALLAAIPLLLLFLVLIGPDDLRLVLDLVMPATSSASSGAIATVERMITAVVASRREISLYGVPLFLLFSTRLFSSTRIALDHIRHVRTKRRFVHDMAYDLFMVIATTTLFAANSYISLPALGLAPIDRFGVHALAVTFGTMLFFVVYFLAPTQKLDWRIAFSVAFIVSVIFEISKTLFGVYLVRFATVHRVISHANAIAVLLFVLWVYVIAVIFLLGGEIAKAAEERRQGVGGAPAPPLTTQS